MLLPRLYPLALALALSGAAAGAAEPAPPQLPPEQGAYVGLRAGFALPLGRFEADAERRELSGVYDFGWPLQLDVGWRFSHRFRAGLYVGYAPLAARTFCPAGLSCHASSLRAGLGAEYHLATQRRLHGWLGLGVGYEGSRVRIRGHNVDVETRYEGFEWLGASVGADYRLLPRLTLGPALTWTFARYTSRESRLGSGSGTESLAHPALHCWVLLGARVQWAF